MAIIIKDGLFTLNTKNTTYQFCVSEYGHLIHLYYGSIAKDCDFRRLYIKRDRGFSGNPYEAKEHREYSLDTLPQEYPSSGNGDYRDCCLEIVDERGSKSCDLKYLSYNIHQGKRKIQGLPSVRGDSADCSTLEVSLFDKVSGIEVVLCYSVFENEDIIVKSTIITNHSDTEIRIDAALSACLDLYQPAEYDFISFYGRHAGERNFQRERLTHGKKKIESARGASSLQYNPSGIICETDANEVYGRCYGFVFVYSGNFVIQIEKDQIDQIRTTIGINPHHFSWSLKSGDSFYTPELIMTFSNSGLETITHNLHNMINRHLINPKFTKTLRPVLLNSWEACYFDFDDNRILELAERAKKLNIDLLVMDDGWFGERNDDKSSLGDWAVNSQKISSGLNVLSERINQIGLKFGIWIEPEMISENSKLFQEHPDWVLKYPDRDPGISRYQFVLDMSREDVVDYLYTVFDRLLSQNNIYYIKWDMNRNISDIYSNRIPSDKQGELSHRYILGVYSLLERLTQKHPDILLETCSGGGGRFDAGMLYYSPQIWCSDNTDPIARIDIQYGTSFIYPLSSISSHVSASPNHQTGRSTPIELRGAVAMTGAFGYELDPKQLSEIEQDIIRQQIEEYKANQTLYSYGRLFRLTSNCCNSDYAWMIVSDDQKRSIITYVVRNPIANAPARFVYPRGLNGTMSYDVIELKYSTSGEELMKGGIALPDLTGDYPFIVLHLIETHE